MLMPAPEHLPEHPRSAKDGLYPGIDIEASTERPISEIRVQLSHIISRVELRR